MILTGGYTIIQERLIKKDQTQHTEMTSRSLLITALALSIDNLAVGFALAVYPVDIWLAAVTFGVVSTVMSLVGLEVRHFLGKRAAEWSEAIGGGVLILVGVAIALGVLG